MKQENINKLQKDMDMLIDIHSKLINKGDFGSALNVMKNIDMLTNQLKNIDYNDMYSKYEIIEEDGKNISLISTWKQNSLGDIKDHKTYEIKKEYNETTYEMLNKISKNWNNIDEKMKNEILKLFNFNNKEDESASYNKWYEILKVFIEAKQSQLIRLDYSNKEEELKHRGTGKTESLIKLSNDYDIPILTGEYGNCKSFIKKRASDLNLNVTVLDYKTLNTKQFENVDMLLVDEDMSTRSDDHLMEFYKNKIFIGFKRN